jgi:hypothetical protein
VAVVAAEAAATLAHAPGEHAALKTNMKGQGAAEPRVT